MFYEPARRPRDIFAHDPFKAIIAPRPIAWVSSLDKEGRANLAPYSFFNALAEAPPVIVFSVSDHKTPDIPERKDTLANIQETGEFVVNIVPYALRDAMNVSSAPLPIGADEFEAAGLEKAASHIVAPPRVVKAPASLECRLRQTIPLPSDPPGRGYTAVLGEVVGVHLDARFIREGRFDVAAFAPMARLGYADYLKAADLFSLARPVKRDSP